MPRTGQEEHARREQSTETSLLARVRDPADGQAWGEFERRYRDLIVAYARRRRLQLYDAEDVAQLVLLSLTRSLRNFTYQPERGRFRDYLGRIVRNAVLRYESCAPERRPQLAGELAETWPAAEGGEDEWEDEWVRHHLRRALEAARRCFEPSSLEMFRELLDGRAPADIAAARGLGVDAVYKVRQRLRDFLEAEIARQVADEEFPQRG